MLLRLVSIRHPLFIILAMTLLTLGIGVGVKQFSFSNDYRDYFSKQNPQLKRWERLQQIYNKTDNVLLTVTPGNGDVFNRRTLSILVELTEAAWKIPFVTRVDSITNYQHITAREMELDIKDLVEDPHTFTLDDIRRVKQISLAHPLIVNRMINEQGTTAAVNATTSLSEHPREQINEISHYVYNLAQEFEARYPDINIHITGSVPYNYALTEASKHDIKTVMILMYLVILLVLGVFLRTISGTIATLGIIMFSVIATMGAAGWSGITLMAPTLSAPTIIMTLALANSVHILVSFFAYLRQGSSKADAIRNSIAVNFSPILITNLTTAIGFLTLNFSDVPPYRDLGNIVAGGLLFVVVFSIFGLPALLQVLPIKAQGPNEKRGLRYFQLAELIIRHKKVIPILFIGVTAILATGISNLELNDRFVEWMDARYEFRRDSDFINENLTGLYRLDWSLDASGENGISKPAYLKTLNEFATWFKDQPGVVHVHTLADIFKEINMKMHGGDPAFYRIPTEQNLASQLLLVYELSLPLGLDITNMVDVSKSSTRFVVRTRNLSSQNLLALEKRAQEWLHNNGLPSMVSEAASTSILFANISHRNIRALLGGTIAALIIISFMLIVPLKNFRIGLFSLVPNILPVVIGFGIWGYVVGQVGLAISVVVGITFGIVVDDTVHFLSKYLRFRRAHHLEPEQAIRETLVSVGPAVLGTSIILAAGFCVLSTSGFILNAQMGALTTIIIITACICDLFLLPALLLLIDRQKMPTTNLSPYSEKWSDRSPSFSNSSSGKAYEMKHHRLRNATFHGD